MIIFLRRVFFFSSVFSGGEGLGFLFGFFGLGALFCVKLDVHSIHGRTITQARQSIER